MSSKLMASFAALATAVALSGCGNNASDPNYVAPAGQGVTTQQVVAQPVVRVGSAIVYHKVSEDFSSYYRGIDCDTGATWVHYGNEKPLASASPALYTPQGTLAVAAFCKANRRDPGFVEKGIDVPTQMLAGPRVVMEKITTPSGYTDYYRGVDCDTGLSWTQSTMDYGMSQTPPTLTSAAALDRLAAVCRAHGSTPGFVAS